MKGRFQTAVFMLCATASRSIPLQQMTVRTGEDVSQSADYALPLKAQGKNPMSINRPSPKEAAPLQKKVVCRPRHIHLSIGRYQNSTHSSMTASFSFSPKCLDLFDDDALMGAVRVWDRSENFDILVLGDEGDVRSYSAPIVDKHLKPIERDGMTHYFSDLHYHIEIDGLKPGSKYSYKCLLLQQPNPSSIARKDQRGSVRLGQNDVSIRAISKSDESTFFTPPAPGNWYSSSPDNTIKFAVLGDLAVTAHSRQTVHILNQHHLRFDGRVASGENVHLPDGQGIDCVLLAGDLAYANSNHDIWDEWMDMMSAHEFFRTVPLQVALGNHDLDYDPKTMEIALSYESRFRMPQVRPALRDLAPNDLFHHGNMIQAKTFVPYEFGNAYYSFSFGPSTHIVLSSYSSFLPASVQYQWLVSKLQAIDRSITPWLVVMIHCPIYTTFTNHRDEIFITAARTHLEPLFFKYSVNVVFAGHVHSYMRTAPTANSTLHPRGPIYIIQGNGGRQVNEPYTNEVPEEWVEVRDNSMYGFGSLELYNHTHAKWTWVKTGFNTNVHGKIEPNFSIHDDVWIMNQLFVAADGYPMHETDKFL
ncbi:hypothetical protein HJC23_010914 [Cyclotella cryptica]|uniref:Purple acid phosphatase n=1 Tax=Cyclotella cryptica TaxID=29204 RepID=A0ABD3Q8U3_9STRA|eukprot:CCRYP_007548-RA/>CCRYP_007548-RA protein AED:0.13 eAED:0.13 QI:0/-1/0/1/-1/1/1/0/587